MMIKQGRICLLVAQLFEIIRKIYTYSLHTLTALKRKNIITKPLSVNLHTFVV